MKAKDHELRAEYPSELIKSGTRGKYSKRVRESANVRIDADLQEFFPNADAVNRALREYLAQKNRTTR